MDWFEKLTGFRETGYEETQARLAVMDGRLVSRVNGASYGIGELEMVSLQALRERAKSTGNLPGRLKTSVITGDVRRMHEFPENAGALFQVASQFNLLEMVSPDVTPEDGVTRYQSDHTPVGDLWTMRNGYALCTQTGLDAIAQHLGKLTTDRIDVLRGKLRIEIHRGVEVTDAAGPDRPRVSQAFCSALPVAYASVPPAHWEPFAVLVLETAYEATLWAAVLSCIILFNLSNRLFIATINKL